MDFLRNIFLIIADLEHLDSNPQQSTNLLTDPYFIVPTAISILMVLIGIVTWLQTRHQKKGVTCKLIAATQVLTVQSIIQSKVKILFGNTPVKNLSLVILQVRNSGDLAIELRDYDNNNPITFDFGKGAKVLEVEKLQTKPTDFNVTLRVNAGKVLLDPILLNRKNEIEFKVLLTGYNESYGVKVIGTRMVDVENIQVIIPVMLSQVTRKSLYRWAIVFILVGNALGYGLQAVIGRPSSASAPIAFFFVLFFKNLGIAPLLTFILATRITKVQSMLIAWVIIAALVSLLVTLLLFFPY